MKKSIVLIPLPSLIKNSFVRSFVRSLSLYKKKKKKKKDVLFGTHIYILFFFFFFF